MTSSNVRLKMKDVTRVIISVEDNIRVLEKSV